MLIASEYNIVNHGCMVSDYFQGAGTSCTDWKDVATGIGDTEKEALDDALDMLGQQDWSIGLTNSENDLARADDTDSAASCGDGESTWFVSVYVK